MMQNQLGIRNGGKQNLLFDCPQVVAWQGLLEYNGHRQVFVILGFGLVSLKDLSEVDIANDTSDSQDEVVADEAGLVDVAHRVPQSGRIFIANHLDLHRLPEAIATTPGQKI